LLFFCCYGKKFPRRRQNRKNIPPEAKQ